MNKPIKTVSYVVVILAVSLVIARIFIATEPGPDTTARKVSLPAVDVFVIKLRNLLPEVGLTGRLRPANKAQLRFELSGRIAQRLVEPGNKVKKNQVLLTLENGDFRDALTQAKAQHTLEKAGIQRDKKLLNLAVNNSRLQVTEVRRLTSLRRKSLISKTRLGAARQKLYQLRSEEARLNYLVETAKARLSLRKAALEKAQRNLDRTRLTASFSGVVNIVRVQKGDSVSPTRVVVELVSDTRLELVLHVRNKTAASLRMNDQVKVRIGDKQVVGTIIALQSDPDSSTFTHELRIRIPAGVGRSGMLAQVLLRLRPLLKVVAVPASAVMREQGAAYLMVIDKQNKVSRRSVVLGLRVANWIVIRAHLMVGEEVIKKDIAALRDGQKVRRRQYKPGVNVSKQ